MHMRYGKAFAGLAILGVLAGPAIAQDSPIRVAIYNLTPFGGDPPGGYCVELMDAIAERTGMTIAEYRPMGVPDMMPAVATGAVDVLCSALAPTNARREVGVAFTSALFTNGETIVVRADNANRYPSLADMRGLRIAAGEGTANLTQLQNAGHDNIVIYQGNQATGAELLLNGQADAMVTNAAEFRYNQLFMSLWPQLKSADGYVPVRVSHAALAVRPEDTALLGILQATLEAMKLDGSLAALNDRYGLPQPPF